ncbi:hypothetical protein UFOVP27_35 [uncultured Caudovirales phage]|uniref:Uncharacterized protein n=1 Tax=uncultured Caudovirales phage TaxID=2100421 RepID=A0A6J5KL20_9CAUD|nr:hypothetical protein UFOVP27_35 [uncultured Caudovirales phage]
MARDKKPLPGVGSVDASDKESLSSTFVPNPNQKPVERSRRLIPPRTEVKSDIDGNTVIVNHPVSVVGTVAHINNPLLNRTSSMLCQYKGGHNVGGTSSSNCAYPATHHVRDTSRPRGSVLGLCTSHKAKVEQEAIQAGRDLEVGKLTPKNTEEIKKVQTQDAEKTNWKVAATLSEQGVPEEDALSFNMAKTPGRPAHKRGASGVSVSTAPQMDDQEAADYNAERIRNNKDRVSPLQDIDLLVEKRGGPGSETKVKIGNKSPKVAEKDLPLGQGTGIIDAVHRMYKAGDSNWESVAAQHGIHRSSITGEPFNLVKFRPNKEFTDKLLYTNAPERIDKAITNVSEDQSEQVTIAHAQNALANKQRSIEARRRGLPSSKPGLPMRRNSSFELGGNENKSIEGPKE